VPSSTPAVARLIMISFIVCFFLEGLCHPKQAAMRAYHSRESSECLFS